MRNLIASTFVSIDGILQADQLRDYLYARMRGARGETEGADKEPAGPDRDGEAVALLREIRDALRSLADRREAAP